MRAEEAYKFRDQVDLYFDNALQQDDQQRLLQQVSSDPDANQMFQEAKNFRDFIKNNVKRQKVSPELINSIKERIKVV